MDFNKHFRERKHAHNAPKIKTPFGRVFARIVFYSALLWCIFAVYQRYLRIKTETEKPDPQLTFIEQPAEGDFSSGALYLALKERGVRQEDIGRIVAALSKKTNTRDFRPNEKFLLTLKTDGGFHRLVMERGANRYILAGLKGGNVNCRVEQMKVVWRRRVVAGNVSSSLWESMTTKGLSGNLVLLFTDIFSWNIDFLTETRDGDAYALVWDEKTAENGVILEQKILSGYYRGKVVGKKEGLVFGKDFYALDGSALERMFLRSPIQFRNYRISSLFSNRRFHPVLKIYRPHHGIDYAAPRGTPVSAVAKGTVVSAARNGGMGKCIKIKHSFGYTTYYGHLNGYAKKISAGARVKQGQTIGYIGSTGLATGPHLDFRIKQGKKFFNFLKMPNRSASSLSRAEMAKFKPLANEWNEMMLSAVKTLEK